MSPGISRGVAAPVVLVHDHNWSTSSSNQIKWWRTNSCPCSRRISRTRCP